MSDAGEVLLTLYGREMSDAGEVLLTLYGREMSDAGEVLLTLYGRIEALGPAAAQALAAVFGLRVQEYVYCEACALETHKHSYTQYFYNTQATGLREARRERGSGVKMGALLRGIEEQARKTCDQDAGGCNTLLPVVHALLGAPHVFTLQLAWESHREEAHNIAATMAAVDERVDLHAVYRGVNPGQHVYRLRSLVCYYGAHYFAFVLLPELGAWVMFDDTRVSRVGAWADVRRKCEAGRIQPSVLFYEQV
ncbi:hypothetical protein N2152v2_008136 [Parachlorella kessleri]